MMTNVPGGIPYFITSSTSCFLRINTIKQACVTILNTRSKIRDQKYETKVRYEKCKKHIDFQNIRSKIRD